MEKKKVTNRLSKEKSPYLLQHAENPVDWFPWSDEAFRKAREENKPIFLSIGYSTCHWCHVMAHESFSDDTIAGLLNESFISIKVDREERPDIDQVYMTVCQAMTGQGGWPLTIIMTPGKEPFFAATYIPKQSRSGMIGLLDLLPRIKDLWKTQHDEMVRSAGQVSTALADHSRTSQSGQVDQSILDRGFGELAQAYDSLHCGFGTAPKFPSPHTIMFLLRTWRRTGSDHALLMAVDTLRAMRSGGIYDHIGYGIHRYSTDREWLVPHFEKMLYDQALLALAYTEGYLATNNELFKRTAEEILSYVLRDLTDSAGGFYSAVDADSEGIEGKFYVWSEEEIRNVLPAEDSRFAMQFFNIRHEGNFSEEASGKRTGQNILHTSKTALNGFTSDSMVRLGKVQAKLFEARENRIHPGTDDKILTDWNGLMVAALSSGYRVYEDERYIEAAIRATEFILSSMRRSDGRLLHRYRDGSTGITANLDDYAFLVWGLVELYEATFNSRFLKSALTLVEMMTDHFWDDNAGGFFFTPNDGEQLIFRQKEVYDGAIPSGNSVAMYGMLLLARLTGRTELEERAWETANAFSNVVSQSTMGHTFFLAALDLAFSPSHEVVVVGSRGSIDTMLMLSALRRHVNPHIVVLYLPVPEEPEITSLAPFTKGMKPIEGKATAYICTGHSCVVPTTDVPEMLRILRDTVI